jgi:uncharacterized protein YegP (UPF0339 family)
MKEAAVMAATRLVYERSDGRWTWRLTEEDSRVIASGGSQGYANEKDARVMADRVIAGQFSGADKRRRPRSAPVDLHPVD